MTTIHTPIDPARVLGNLRGADMVLTAAQAGDLPMPFNIDISDFTDRVGFQFRTLDELTQWAMWLEEVIVSGPLHGSASVRHLVLGSMFDQPLRLVKIADDDTAEVSA